MFEKLEESLGNVVGYKAIGTLTASDYLKLEPEVKALVEREGKICMLMKFGSEFHKVIQKMAIVGDKTWEKWITYLAKPFYAGDAKFFHTSDIKKAWAWPRE